MPENLPHDEPGVLRADVLVVGAGVDRRVAAPTSSPPPATPSSSSTCSTVRPRAARAGRSLRSARNGRTRSTSSCPGAASVCCRDFSRDHGIDVGYRPAATSVSCPRTPGRAQLDAVELQHSARRAGRRPRRRARPPRSPRSTPDGIAGATWGSADGVVDPQRAGHPRTSTSLAGTRCPRSSSGTRSAQSRPMTRRAGWATARAGPPSGRSTLVNAAGGWAGEVGRRWPGSTCRSTHSRRNIYATAPGASSTAGPDDDRLRRPACYLRSEGERLLFGGARPDEPDGYNLRVDWPWMEALLELAVPRFPWLGRPPARPGRLLGRHLREHPGPPRHPRPGPGARRPGSTPAASPATASCRLPRSAGSSPSRSPPARSPASTPARCASSGSPTPTSASHVELVF